MTVSLGHLSRGMKYVAFENQSTMVKTTVLPWGVRAMIKHDLRPGSQRTDNSRRSLAGDHGMPLEPQFRPINTAQTNANKFQQRGWLLDLEFYTKK